MAPASIPHDRARREPDRRDETAFGAWLRMSLQQGHAATLAEPIPAELLALCHAPAPA